MPGIVTEDVADAWPTERLRLVLAVGRALEVFTTNRGHVTDDVLALTTERPDKRLLVASCH